LSKKKDKTKPITSQLELATRCGVSRNALAKHFRREVFPVSRQGPWDEHHVDMIRAYLDALPGNNQGGDQRDEKDKVDIRLKLERVAKLKRGRSSKNFTFSAKMSRSGSPRGRITSGRVLKLGRSGYPKGSWAATPGASPRFSASGWSPYWPTTHGSLDRVSSIEMARRRIERALRPGTWRDTRVADESSLFAGT